MTWTGRVEENFRTQFQKFELYIVWLKQNNVKCALFLHIAGEKAIDVYNALTFTEVEEGKFNAMVCKFKEFVESKKDLAHKCSLLHLLIMWLTVSFLSPHNKHLHNSQWIPFPNPQSCLD